MTLDKNHDTSRVKFVYNAQFPAPTAVVLDYLLRHEAFTSRQGRQLGMDAMMTFYRPMAEEFHGELSVSEIQDIARHCVERLAKQIDDICNRYQIAYPMTSATTLTLGDLSSLERVLERGLLRIAESLQSRVTISVHPAAVPELEWGIDMDSSGIGPSGISQ